jgi:hypothetical protein
LDEATRHKLDEHQIPPKEYLAVSYLFTNLESQKDQLPLDVYGALLNNSEKFSDFENAIGIVRPYQSLEAVTPNT